jgi:hypothetical protein
MAGMAGALLSAQANSSEREINMNTDKIIILARRHLTGAISESSARICLADAIALMDSGETDFARLRAIKSLKYSVGIFHKDFQRAIHNSDGNCQ